LLNSVGTVTGGTVIYPKLAGKKSEKLDFKFNDRTGLVDYKITPKEKISFRFTMDDSFPELGRFNPDTQVQLKINWEPTNPTTGLYVNTYMDESAIDGRLFTSSAAVTSTVDYTALFTIQNWGWASGTVAINGLEFELENTEALASGKDIWVNDIYLYVYYFYQKGTYKILKKKPWKNNIHNPIFWFWQGPGNYAPIPMVKVAQEASGFNTHLSVAGQGRMF